MPGNIDAALIKAEQEALRLRQQAEQEAAMAVALPLRFEQNMAAFRQYIPHIADMYEHYQPARPFRFFCNENGQPNLAWLDDDVAVYGKEPYLICETLVTEFMEKGGLSKFSFSQEANPLGFMHVEYLNRLNAYLDDISAKEALLAHVPSEVPSALVFGVGLGYHLGYLYERCKIGTLFLFEPDLDLFYGSLFCFDWAPLLSYLHQENLGLHILLGQDEETIVKDFASAIHSRGSFLVANAFIMWGYQSDKIKKLIERLQQEHYLLVMGWGFFDDNLIALSHTINNIERGVPFLQRDLRLSSKYQRVPVFIVANGPSLDGAISVIAENKDKAIIVSCGSAISALHRVGIKPDIHVETERTKIVYDFLVNLDDPDYLRDVLFLSTDVIHPDCATLFNQSALAFKLSEPGVVLYQNYFSSLRPCAALGGVNPLVGNIGISAPIHLGFKQLYLFGLDNGYKHKGHHHSRLSSYYNDEESAGALGEMMYGDSLWQREGNFGGTVISNAMFDTSRRVMEQVLANNDDVRCFNCSDGARIAHARALPSGEIHLSQPVDKRALLGEIAALCAPIPLSKEDFSSLLDVEFFNLFIDKMMEEWRQPFSSRNELNQLMLRNFGYLGQIAVTRQQHISQTMVGSMNYVFTLLSSILYSFEGEEETLALMKPAIELWLEFLEKAREMYPRALDSVDMVDNEVMALFRKKTVNS
ncbi:motility associated factor glycosyltransferase family protein [Aeromonas sanarellii]|uniref:Motility associated factor glycosyltransferase family protein n=1 Tax=Aeromonas sanarellii TaxID=633415 RepID=A0ABS4B0J0_9GAMM|nr:6-hydroxymethylpterin diphosphokinase MptE-like protein [Aeromonas sanarellii]MBP0601001.1 motility associated factor glycosyltransferase family protein [Aeromonas sanarellii]